MILFYFCFLFIIHFYYKYNYYILYMLIFCIYFVFSFFFFKIWVRIMKYWAYIKHAYGIFICQSFELEFFFFMWKIYMIPLLFTLDDSFFCHNFLNSAHRVKSKKNNWKYASHWWVIANNVRVADKFKVFRIIRNGITKLGTLVPIIRYVVARNHVCAVK